MRSTAVLFVLLSAGLLAGNPVCPAQTSAPAPPATPAKSSAPAAAQQPAWVLRSNQYTKMLLDAQLKFSPESASLRGLAQYDSAITDATRAAEIAQRKQLEDILANLNKIEANEKDRNVRADLQIIQQAFHLQFLRDDYQLHHSVQFFDASQAVYVGLSTLLNDQVAADRRPAAVVRLRKYAGVEPGFIPFSDVLKQRMIQQMAKPGVVYPSSAQVEGQLARDKNYVDSIGTLFVKYKLTGWKEPYAKLQQELADYDTWVRSTVMPKTGADTRMPPEKYVLTLQSSGIDLPPDQLAAQAHAAFTQCQEVMAPLAVKVAKQHGWVLTDYRDVIRQLKKDQIVGDAILPFYKETLKQIEQTVASRDLVTLPDRPVAFRLASADQSVKTPFPHIVPPPFVDNTGQRGVVELPLSAYAPPSDSPKYFDDFTYQAAAWPIVAHEARPGNDLEFDSMLRTGMSNARLLYAFNTTDTDGWGYYSEWLMQPYEPLDSQLITMQRRLLIDAQAFLDIDLQSGKISAQDALRMLENDVDLSPAYASEEIDRFLYRSPGQAPSYFYAYATQLQLRKDTEAALGTGFDVKQFNDFVLAQGLLPPNILRQAVMEDFIPAHKKK